MMMSALASAIALEQDFQEPAFHVSDIDEYDVWSPAAVPSWSSTSVGRFLPSP
jgi:hypothetical protein